MVEQEPRRLATVVLEFLNEYYIHPGILHQNQYRVREIYEFLEKMMDLALKDKKEGESGYNLYELTTNLSVYNKILTYYSLNSTLHEQWKNMISRVEKEIIRRFQSKK